MFARLASFAIAACALSSTDAFGQVYYGGYNLGPDYGEMARQAIERQNQIVRQAEQRGQQAVQETMNNPRCKAMYQQHQQEGGRLSYQQFAYEYARTGGFTAEGKAFAFNVEQNNQAKEKASYQAYLEAQQRSREAMGQWQEGYRRNQAEAGNVMTGKMTYVAPNGQQHVLPYTQPGTWQDRNTGVVYNLDQYGRYFMRDANGWWVPLQPGR